MTICTPHCLHENTAITAGTLHVIFEAKMPMPLSQNVPTVGDRIPRLINCNSLRQVVEWTPTVIYTLNVAGTLLAFQTGTF